MYNIANGCHQGFINQRRTAGAQKSSTLEIKAYLETQHPLTKESSESVQIYGLNMVCLWMMHGFSMVYLWMSKMSMVYLWFLPTKIREPGIPAR
jgi:hypothetical protein